MKTKNKVLILVGIIIIIIGIVITVTKGFNFDLRYEGGKRIELNLQKTFESSDIKQIAKEVIGQDVVIQKVEIYEDAVSILSKDITEDQKNQIVTKINEKYGTEINAENTEIITVPHTHLRDLAQPYIIPFVIATVVILIYIGIRYYKLNIIKTIAKTIGIVIIWQVILYSIMAITRIPIGRLTIPLTLTIYMLSFVYCTTKFEKDLKQQKQSKEKE